MYTSRHAIARDTASKTRAFFLIALLLGSFSAAGAQDVTRLGGDLTSDLPGRFALQLPAPNVVAEDRRRIMLDGFPVFHSAFSAGQGVGPFFVNNSCAGCHVQNGRGRLGFGRSSVNFTGQIVRVSLRKGRSFSEVPGVGSLLQNHSVSGKRRFRLRLSWRVTKHRYPDGERYTLRKPNLRFRIPGVRAKRVVWSLRMTPPVIGTGLLEAVPEETLIALSDPGDANGDGISGRVSRVIDVKTNAGAVGRFGFKALRPTVEEQSLAAAFGEMGLTSYLFPGEGGGEPELPFESVEPLVQYQRLAGVPPARDQDRESVSAGKRIFGEIGCSGCHVTTLQTGENADPELANQLIHPFTDLLLHDMGPGLADGRPEGDANGREWRTAPLWGLGFSETLSDVRATFLHDGRARTVEEAVLWHGGEAEPSKQRFRALSRSERQELIEFLRSL